MKKLSLNLKYFYRTVSRSVVLSALLLATVLLATKESQAQEEPIVKSYLGEVVNTSFDLPGVITINFTQLPTKKRGKVAGYVDFDGNSQNALCGAGNFVGKKRRKTVKFRFRSDDPDVECGFDDGLFFTIRGKLRRSPDGEKNAVLRGYYRVKRGQRGKFNALVTPPIE